MGHFTATMLVWRHYYFLHTASIVWNKLVRMSNGNRPGKVKEFLDIMYQNLPGVLGVTTLGTQIESIISRLKPDVLFIGEADSDLVRTVCPDGYVWVGGNLKAKKEEIRVPVLVNDKIPFKQFKIDTQVPAVGLKIGEWKLVGIYREWALCGDQTTKSRELQVNRLQNFVDYWLTLKGKGVCLGDFNFDPFPTTEYQKGLEPIRTLVNNIILPVGWRQLIRGETRFEADVTPSLLDHIYVNQVDCTSRTWNENVTGYDHNLVGVRVKSQGVIFKSETFEYRHLKPVTVRPGTATSLMTSTRRGTHQSL